MGYVLTKAGRELASAYIGELAKKREEILKAGTDTAEEVNLPTVEDIEDDVNLWGYDSDLAYSNGWNATDNCGIGYPLVLLLGHDFVDGMEVKT